MISHLWLNMQHPQAGLPSQSATQLPGDTGNNNKQAAGNTRQYWTANTGVQPPRSTLQAASVQQPTGVSHYLMQNVSNTQSGNPRLLVNNTYQVAAHKLQQNSCQNVSTQSLPNTMYPQQNVSTYQPVLTQNNNIVYDHHQRGAQATTQSLNGGSLQQAPTNRHAVHNQNTVQNGLQHGVSNSPSSYYTAIAQYSRYDSSSANPNPSRKHYKLQPKTARNTGGQTNYTANSLNHSRRQYICQTSPRTNQNPTDDSLRLKICVVDNV